MDPPGVHNNIDIVTRESLFGILRDLFRVRVQYMVSTLDDGDFHLVFQNLRVLWVSHPHREADND